MSKAIPKAEYVRHPYTKQKLRVIDTFTPKEETDCPGCKDGVVEEIKIVESEYRGGVRYNIVNCTTCEQPLWVVFN